MSKSKKEIQLNQIPLHYKPLSVNNFVFNNSKNEMEQVLNVMGQKLGKIVATMQKIAPIVQQAVDKM